MLGTADVQSGKVMDGVIDDVLMLSCRQMTLSCLVRQGRVDGLVGQEKARVRRGLR